MHKRKDGGDDTPESNKSFHDLQSLIVRIGTSEVINATGGQIQVHKAAEKE